MLEGHNTKHLCKKKKKLKGGMGVEDQFDF